MLSRLFRSKGRSSGRWRAAQAPQGTRIYAVGDIHGRLDLFGQLIDLIADDDAAREPANTHLILLGDYVDRGPDSAALLTLLRNVVAPSGNVAFLKGNHEDYMLAAYDGDISALAPWLRYGGWETLRSYGLEDTIIERRDGSVIDAMRSAIPDADIDFLRSLSLTQRHGDYLFVHAGILPGIALDEQCEQDMLWIRDRFTGDDRNHGVVVVHGHTITDAPQMRRNRIGIDTGAYDSGHLTAVGLEGDQQWFLQTGDGIEPDREGEPLCALLNP